MWVLTFLSTTYVNHAVALSFIGRTLCSGYK